MKKIEIRDLSFCKTEINQDCHITGGYSSPSYYSLLYSLSDYYDYGEAEIDDNLLDEDLLENDIANLVISENISSDGKLFVRATRGKLNGREFTRSTAFASN